MQRSFCKVTSFLKLFILRKNLKICPTLEIERKIVKTSHNFRTVFPHRARARFKHKLFKVSHIFEITCMHIISKIVFTTTLFATLKFGLQIASKLTVPILFYFPLSCSSSSGIESLPNLVLVLLRGHCGLLIWWSWLKTETLLPKCIKMFMRISWHITEWTLITSYIREKLDLWQTSQTRLKQKGHRGCLTKTLLNLTLLQP